MEELFVRYGPVVHRRARSILRSDEEARDAVQEVFTRVAAKHDTFRGEAEILNWIYRITTNLCLSWLRRRKSRPLVSDPEAVARMHGGESEESMVTRRAVHQALLKVDEKTRRMAVYYYLDQMAMEEIAALLGTSRKTVSKKLARFRVRATALLS